METPLFIPANTGEAVHFVMTALQEQLGSFRAVSIDAQPVRDEWVIEVVTQCGLISTHAFDPVVPLVHRNTLLVLQLTDEGETVWKVRSVPEGSLESQLIAFKHNAAIWCDESNAEGLMELAGMADAMLLCSVSDPTTKSEIQRGMFCQLTIEPELRIDLPTDSTERWPFNNLN